MANPRKPDFGFEPELDDVLEDPVVRSLMDSDGVGRDDILDLAASARERCGSDEDEGDESAASHFDDDESWQ